MQIKKTYRWLSFKKRFTVLFVSVALKLQVIQLAEVAQLEFGIVGDLKMSKSSHQKYDIIYHEHHTGVELHFLP